MSENPSTLTATTMRTMRWEYARAAAPLLRALTATANELVALKATHHASAGNSLASAFGFGLDDDNNNNSESFECIASAAAAALAVADSVASASVPPPLPREEEGMRAARRASSRGGRGGARARPY